MLRRPSHYAALFLVTVASTLLLRAPASTSPDSDVPPALGAERIPADEISDAQAITSLVIEKLAAAKAKAAAAGTPAIVLRDAHPKAHGCVRATVEVRDDFPRALAQGMFAQAARYDAWMRFSNGAPDVQSDEKLDIRGAALKVIGVPGTKILSGDERSTQDFLFVSRPAFFIRTVKDYVSFMKNIPVFLALHAFREGRAFLKATDGEMANPLESRYWSTTPYRLGSEPTTPGGSALAVKYSLKPISCENDDRPLLLTPKSSGPNFLRAAMARSLESGDSCFDLLVQPQLDSVRTPIEDSMVNWDDSGARFYAVARVRIDSRENRGAMGIDQPARQEFCENLKMTPWHSLPEHRPLGGINRARRVVYRAVSKYRSEANGVRASEPTGHEPF